MIELLFARGWTRRHKDRNFGALFFLPLNTKRYLKCPSSMANATIYPVGLLLHHVGTKVLRVLRLTRDIFLIWLLAPGVSVLQPIVEAICGLSDAFRRTKK